MRGLTFQLDAKNVDKDVQILLTGDYVYGDRELSITQKTLREITQNFTPETVAFDYQHASAHASDPDASRAAGWVTGLKTRGKAMYATPRWTTQARNYIAAEEYRFCSVEFAESYKDEKGNNVGSKLLAVAITNRPFLPLEAIQLSKKKVPTMEKTQSYTDLRTQLVECERDSNPGLTRAEAMDIVNKRHPEFHILLNDSIREPDRINSGVLLEYRLRGDKTVDKVTLLRAVAGRDTTLNSFLLASHALERRSF